MFLCNVRRKLLEKEQRLFIATCCADEYNEDGVTLYNSLAEIFCEVHRRQFEVLLEGSHLLPAAAAASRWNKRTTTITLSPVLIAYLPPLFIHHGFVVSCSVVKLTDQCRLHRQLEMGVKIMCACSERVCELIRLWSLHHACSQLLNFRFFLACAAVLFTLKFLCALKLGSYFKMYS